MESSGYEASMRRVAARSTANSFAMMCRAAREFSEAVFRFETDYQRFDITGILHSLG